MQILRIKTDYLHMALAFTLAIIFFNPFNFYKYGLFVLAIYAIVKVFNNKVLYDIQFWVLFVFCLFYATIQLSYAFISITTFIEYLTYPLLLYISGLLIISIAKNEKQILYYLYTVILSFALFGILAVYYSMQIYGTVGGLEMRLGIIPWSKDIGISATGIGIYLSLGIGLSGLLFVKTNFYLKVLSFSIFLLSLYSSVVLANRTGLIVAVLSIMLVYFTQIRQNSIKYNIKISFLMMIQFLLLIILFNKNAFNVKMMWLQSNAFVRFTDIGLANDPRFTVWGEAFKGVFTNPLGGKQAQLSLGYAHNLWLDVGWTTGLFPFALLVVFTLLTIKDYIKLLRNEEMSLYFKYLITAMLCSFFITFMVEPVIEANILFFCAFCFVAGVIRSINKRVANPLKKVFSY